MSTTSEPVLVSSGTVLVDQSVIPYIRASEVEFSSLNLRPYRKAYFFFDDTNVTSLVQVPSILIVDSSNNSVGNDEGDGLYCPATKGFATVIATSPRPNTSIGVNGGSIYLNENYISINVAPYGANTLSSTNYNIGDIIYQDPTVVNTTIANAIMQGVLSSNTFSGKVKYWDSANGVLVVSPISGTLKSNASTSNSNTWIYNSNASVLVAPTGILPATGNKFIDSSVILNVTKGIKTYSNTSNSYFHNSGIIATPNTGAANNIIVTANLANSTAVGNTLYITSGTGIRQNYGIVSISPDGKTIFLGATMNTYIDGTSTYSIGNSYVDENGVIAGIFQIPEAPTLQFLTGTRVFTITDTPIVNDADATMKASANYVAQGYLQTYQSIRTTPVVQDTCASRGSTATSTPVNPSLSGTSTITQTLVDTSQTPLADTYIDYTVQPPTSPQIRPIAQTFTTPPPKSLKQNYGIFVTSVSLWFNAKPEGLSPQFPVTVQIVGTTNGIPDTTTIYGTSIVHCESINVTDSPSYTNGVTQFTFPDPIYLLPSTKYAIIVTSQSPDYEIYYSQVGAVDITSGSSQSRVSSAPYAGDFFTSQNASVWNPIQNQNLMFVINKASFSNQPVAITYNIDPVTGPIFMDNFTMMSSDLVLPSTILTYKIDSTLFNDSNNTFYLSNNLIQVSPGSKYDFGDDLSISGNSYRRRYIPAGNATSLQLQVDLQSFDPDVSPVYNAERLGGIVGTNFINNGGISSNNISIVKDAGGHSNVANITVTIGPPQLANGTQAYANVLSSAISNGKITKINVTYPGSGYITSPTIVLDDKTPGSANSNTGTGFVATVTGEDQQYGGNGIAKYITKKISLASGFDSGDLRVWIDGIIPSGTSVSVYYKVLSSSDTDSFIDKKWKLMSAVNPVVSPDQNTPVEIQYAPSPLIGGKPSGQLSYVENGITYPIGGTFKYFSIKIVMFSADPTIIPQLTGLRVAALPAG